jgi:hypothetical protein
MPPKAAMGLLDGVLRPAGVVEDPKRDGVQSVAVHTGEDAERVSVALGRLLDDRPVHRPSQIAPVGGGMPRLQMDVSISAFKLRPRPGPGRA